MLNFEEKRLRAHEKGVYKKINFSLDFFLSFCTECSVRKVLAWLNGRAADL